MSRLERMTKLDADSGNKQASKQANNGHTVVTRAATGVCSGRRRVSGGVVGGEW